MSDYLTSEDLVFTAGSHRYHIRDSKPKIYIPSVTTITGLMNKPYLVEWAAREASEAAVDSLVNAEQYDDATIQAAIATGRKAPRGKREHGASVGTIVHTHIQHQLGKIVDDLPETCFESELALGAFQEWWHQHSDDVEILAVEQIVVEKTGLYCGTYDALIRDGDYIKLVDFKTSNASETNPLAIYPEYLFQIAAYWNIVRESYPDAVIEAEIVAVGKDGQLGVTILTEEKLFAYTEGFMLLARMLPMVRAVERDVRSLNKQERDRRSQLEEGSNE